MVFKNLLINNKKSSKKRLSFLKKHLDMLEEGEDVVFLGSTFEENDLNLSFLIGMMKFLGRYPKSTFYIQDEKGGDDSWYNIPEWPSHVTVFRDVIDVNLVFDEFSDVLKFKEEVNGSPVTDQNALHHNIDIQLIKTIEKTHFEHKDDIVGAFINEVKNKELDPYIEASMIKIGLDALLRR